MIINGGSKNFPRRYLVKKNKWGYEVTIEHVGMIAPNYVLGVYIDLQAAKHAVAKLEGLYE